MAKRQI